MSRLKQAFDDMAQYAGAETILEATADEIAFLRTQLEEKERDLEQAREQGPHYRCDKHGVYMGAMGVCAKCHSDLGAQLAQAREEIERMRAVMEAAEAVTAISYSHIAYDQNWAKMGVLRQALFSYRESRAKEDKP